ncbi:MAG: hypothetical protein DRN08_03460 [Thermoplasmata archaeon]|nr:MAG: hypothetical protein DRN05_03610 [Thermoplasmata archaeon]RLF35191.1 MAG: hypothetical protein DRN08_03460 [Thermoplasmata archaeon]
MILPYIFALLICGKYSFNFVYSLSPYFPDEKAFRRVIAIDETKVKINSKWHIFWAAIDVDTWEILGIWITQGRASFEAYGFIRYVLTKCKNNP